MDTTKFIQRAGYIFNATLAGHRNREKCLYEISKVTDLHVTSLYVPSLYVSVTWKGVVIAILLKIYVDIYYEVASRLLSQVKTLGTVSVGRFKI